MRLPTWSAWLALCPLFVACSVVGDTAQTILPFNMNTPEEIGRSFLDAWNVQDLGAMYNLVAAPSRERYPLEQFQNRYTVANDVIGLTGVTYSVESVTEQGTTAAIEYDVTLQSSVFGTIEDADRIMYLVREDNNWRVAWSTMDILNGMAEEVRLQVDSTLPRRANIYDRNGNPLVEQDQAIKWVAVIKQDMPNEEDCVQLLSRLLLRSTSQMRQFFASYNPDTLFHVGELDVPVYDANSDALNSICGLSVGNGKSGEYISRHYVGEGAMTHIAGFIGSIPAEEVTAYQARGYAESDLVGRTGIEFSYQDILAGRPEKVLRLIEPGGTVIRELGGSEGADPTPIQLTIDRDLQIVLAQAMNDAFNYAEINWASVSSGAAGVIIDVRTGEILALHSYPTFDPSLFNRENSYTDAQAFIAQLTTDRRVPLSNKTIQEQYTPGSIYKLITAIAVTDEGIYQPDQIFDCTLTWSGQEKYGDARLVREDWRVSEGQEAAGAINAMQAIATSCNPFFWEQGAKLYQKDDNALVRYSEQFGLGTRVGMNNLLGPEAAGNVAPPSDPTTAINNAIGQGDIQVNPLQYALAVAAIANRGTLYEPMLVKQVGGFDGTPVLESFTPQVRNTITLPDLVWNTVQEGMCLAVSDQDLGTARFAFDNSTSYSVCGKTGTAETGPTPPHGWFVSFSPAENPEIATLVVVTNGREGSETSAPITRRVLDYYYNQPAAPFPDWWLESYRPLVPPVGVGG